MREKKNTFVSEFLEYVKMIAFSFVFVFLLTTFIIRPVQVIGNSMYPTLEDKELGFTNIIALRLEGIQRFDVVVAYLESRDEQIVKRVIALPNDRIRCEHGILYINDEVIDETYLDSDYVFEQSQLEYDKQFTKDFDEIVLGEDEYFLMGDNRLHSSDSRVFGVFHRDEILSKSVYVWFPFKHMRFVD